MKSQRWSPGASFLLVLTASALAQSNPAPTANPPDGRITAGIISSLSTFGAAGHGVEGVKGSPFSAELTYDFTQALADENRIHRESHAKVFRDSEGRIRNEVEDEMPMRKGMVNITINDPVSQTFITLYPQSKRAVVNRQVVQRDEAGHVIAIGGGFVAASSSVTGARSVDELQEELKARQQAQAPVRASSEQKPRPGLAQSFARHNEDLGAKEIEGFTAHGMRFSNTTPAGEIGNEKPMVTVNETWWSQDLRAVLVSIYDNPQTGRRVMRMTNIQVGEPDSQLFQIPSDYTVQEFPANPGTVKPPQ